MEDQHSREHGEIKAKLDSLGESVKKLNNGKSIDYAMKAAVFILGILELQSRTGIDIGNMPESIINFARGIGIS